MSLSGEDENVKLGGLSSLIIDARYPISSSFSNVEHSYAFKIIAKVNSTLVDPTEQKVNLKFGCYNYSIIGASLDDRY
jgi:hypothetical protein